jgi:hypothetical protein
LFYGLFYKDDAQCCAGKVCEVKKRQTIQNTSWVQVLVVLCSIVFVLLTVVFLNDYFSAAPKSLKEIVRF